MGLEIVLHCSLRGLSHLSPPLPVPTPKSQRARLHASYLSLIAPHFALSWFFTFPSSQLIHVLPLVFLTFRNLCHLLIALDFWALNLRAQALRESPEMQERRP